jgi:hypothetical protein
MKKVFVFLLLGIIIFSCKNINVQAAKAKDLLQTVGKQLYIDVHHLGAGNVTAEAVAEAHKKDLEVQGKFGVNFIQYWVDENSGTIYCLSEASIKDNISKTHAEAHGLLPDDIYPVTDGEAANMSGNSKLFLDIHRLGAGNVTKEAVAEAHKKDLEEQGKHHVNFVNYWVDEVNGNVFCLSESPNANAVKETHANAHGLIPDDILEITKGE